MTERAVHRSGAHRLPAAAGRPAAHARVRGRLRVLRALAAGVVVVAAAGAGAAVAQTTVAQDQDPAVAGPLPSPAEASASAPDESPAVAPATKPTTKPSSKPSTKPTSTPSSTPTLPAGLTEADVKAGLLAADVPERASGELLVVAGSKDAPGAGDVRTVRVEVEDGLAVDGKVFAAFVMETLNDPRGWGADGSVTFARTDGRADLRVVLASPDLVDQMCAPLRTRGQVSCGRGGHATLNLRRWVEAIPEYGADRTGYRRYVVNHEVGHLLGHPHVECPGAGELAPIMQQQSYGVAPCVPNSWPNPEAG